MCPILEGWSQSGTENRILLSVPFYFLFLLLKKYHMLVLCEIHRLHVFMCVSCTWNSPEYLKIASILIWLGILPKMNIGIFVLAIFWKKVLIFFSIWKQILKGEVQSCRLHIKLGKRRVRKVPAHPFKFLGRRWKVVEFGPKWTQAFLFWQFFEKKFQFFFQSENRSWKGRSRSIDLAYQ